MQVTPQQARRAETARRAGLLVFVETRSAVCVNCNVPALPRNDTVGTYLGKVGKVPEVCVGQNLKVDRAERREGT